MGGRQRTTIFMIKETTKKTEEERVEKAKEKEKATKQKKGEEGKKK